MKSATRRSWTPTRWRLLWLGRRLRDFDKFPAGELEVELGGDRIHPQVLVCRRASDTGHADRDRRLIRSIASEWAVRRVMLKAHLPAREVLRLLREKPAAIGLAVPGMPVGSPGMEMPGEMLGVCDAFDVVLVTRDGSSHVYQSYIAKPAIEPSTKSLFKHLTF